MTVPIFRNLELRAVRPNPARSRDLVFELALASRATAHLEILDVMGRRMVELDVPHPLPGFRSLKLPPSVHLRSGVYLVRVLQANALAYGRFVVVE